jgi:glutaredoxin 3
VAVIVYTTPTCPHCRNAKRFLSERRIPYREVDVTRSEASLAELRRKSGQTGVPVIDVNGQVIVGFQRERLIRALGLRG